ncbi:flagellar protein FlgN [Clostridium prolinivorans]|uniref:flagellar protein FlgN n=1 Tax=Clostridium prolinivorans TaxID=2769420 RepID=UPI000FDBEA20|nr:flagellar protein FlgN [Clostridium prolinivorans]
MKEELMNIILIEIEALKELLKILEKQHEFLLKSNAITLEGFISKIEDSNKKIAEIEIKRRQITKGRPMREIIEEIGDNDLDKYYREIKKLIEEVRIQKDSNELLIKQGLSFTNRILNILNPSKIPKIYNSYGQLSKK